MNKNLYNKVNQNFDVFLVKFEKLSEIELFGKMIKRIFDKKWEAEIDEDPNDPFILSFLIVYTPYPKAILIKGKNLDEYLSNEDYIVNPHIYKMDQNKELEDLLKKISDHLYISDNKPFWIGMTK